MMEIMFQISLSLYKYIHSAIRISNQVTRIEEKQEGTVVIL